jgi:LacI family transcriptional regulator, galactose operon repressor
MAAACRPPLTTVDMNLTQLGRTAAQRLLAAIEGHPSHGLHTLPCELVIRESTGTAIPPTGDAAEAVLVPEPAPPGTRRRASSRPAR